MTKEGRRFALNDGGFCFVAQKALNFFSESEIYRSLFGIKLI
jgi:hypothetical protein